MVTGRGCKACSPSGAVTHSFPPRKRADSLHGLRRKVLQAFQAESQVHPAFLAGQGVDFVDDHRAHGLEDLPGTRAGEHEIQRFGRGDQDIGRPRQHRLALTLRRIAGANQHADLGEIGAQLLCLPANTRQRHTQVALNVVVQRLKRRDVHDPNPLAALVSVTPALSCPSSVHLAFLAFAARLSTLHPPQLVDSPQKRGHRLTRAGGREN
jgi:hypothetical protein